MGNKYSGSVRNVASVLDAHMYEVMSQEFILETAESLLSDVLNGNVKPITGRNPVSSVNLGGLASSKISSFLKVYLGREKIENIDASERIDFSISESVIDAMESFKIEHAEDLEKLQIGNIHRHSLKDVGRDDLVEKLDETIKDELVVNTILFEVRFLYLGGNGDGTHKAIVEGAINWDAPSHRPGADNEVYRQMEIDFGDEKDLRRKLAAALKYVQGVF